MKQNKIIVALLAGCLLGACSDNEQPMPGPDTVLDKEAYVTVAVNTGDKDSKTRATRDETDGLPSERVIRDLAIVLIRKTTNGLSEEVQGYGHLELQSGQTTLDTTACVGVKAATLPQSTTTQYKMLLIANAGLTANAPSFKADYYYNLQAKLKDQLNPVDKPLIMTAEKDIEIVPGYNYIGSSATFPKSENRHQISADPVSIRRIAAQVQLSLLSLASEKSLKPLDPDLAEIDNLRFKLEEIFLANVKTASYLLDDPQGKRLGLEYSDSTYYCGVQNFVTTGSADIFRGNTFESAFSHLMDIPYLQKGGKVAFEDNNESGFYVMENSDKATGRYPVIFYLKGSFYDGEKVVLPNRYFRIKLSDGILRNTIYRIEATLTGKGSPEPGDNKENVSLDVKIVLLPWILDKMPDIDIDIDDLKHK